MADELSQIEAHAYLTERKLSCLAVAYAAQRAGMPEVEAKASKLAASWERDIEHHAELYFLDMMTEEKTMRDIWVEMGADRALNR